MSLSRRLFLSISALIIVLLFANMVLSIFNAKRYLSDQLQVLAEDTATSLGLTISHAAEDNDKAQVQTMVNVIFDRGFYLSIIYSDLDGNIIVSRSSDINVEGVPRWFVNFIDIPLRTGKTDIVSGWFQLGSLSVVVHPGYAYRDIWRVFVDQFWLFLVAVVVFYGLTGQALKLLLRPLRALEQQADAISRKEFVVQEKLPRAKELRSVVLAMNRMVERVKEMFALQMDIANQLRRDVAMDSLTGLANKDEFDAQVNAWLKSEEGGGLVACVILRAHNLQVINDRHQMGATDAWLCKIADHFAATFGPYSGAFTARAKGGDFIAIVPGLDVDQGKEVCDQLLDVINTAPFVDLCKINIGALVFAPTVELTHMMSATDGELRKSCQLGYGRSIVEYNDTYVPARPATQWRGVLKEKLALKLVYLHRQKIVRRDTKTELYSEVFSRIEDQGQEIAAGVFWPLLERFGMELAFDRLIVTLQIEFLRQQETNNESFGINLSPKAILSEEFCDWLAKVLSQSGVAERLVFEIPERALKPLHPTFDRFVKTVTKNSAKLALDRFGIMPSSLGCLQNMPLAYVKIDSRFIERIESHTQNQFYVRNLISIARSCDVLTIAEGVETAEQWHQLLELGVDGGQGFYFSSPAPL